MAVKTLLSEFGSKVCVNDENEHLVPALGNGTTGIPGDLCGITAADGKIKGTDLAAVDEFVGILKEDPVTGTEAVIVAGVQCSLIVPKSGHRYRIRCLNLGGHKDVGQGLDFSATPYKADLAADIVHAIMRVSSPYTNTELIVEVTWA